MFKKNKSEKIHSKLINFISKNGNPKEVLCILNLYIDSVKNDIKFSLILYPISLSLEKLLLINFKNDSTAVILICRDVLKSAVNYFKRLPMAHFSGLEGKELEVYVQSTETERQLRVANIYLEFIESMTNNEDFISDNRIKDEIINNILILYDYSLVKLAFNSPGIVAEDCRRCCLRAFSLIEQLTPCLHRLILSLITYNTDLNIQIDLIEDVNEKNEVKDRFIPFTSIACVLYHMFVDNKLNKFPQIFSELYKINFSLPILTVCFQSSLDCNVLRVCLQLLSELLNLLNNEFTLDWQESLYLLFFHSLKVTLISNVNREIRGFAFSAFCKMFKMLNVEGRYNLLKVMLKDNDHHGFRGQLILMLKNEIINGISEKDHQWRYFKGGIVYPLLCDVFIMSDGEKTDILNESEWILASLNLLYVLLKRDVQNIIGLDVIMDDIENDFLKPLIKGIDLNLGHYKNDSRLLLDSDSASVIEELSIDCSWMNKDQKLDFLNKAMLTLDLIKFNVSRVRNLL